MVDVVPVWRRKSSHWYLDCVRISANLGGVFVVFFLVEKLSAEKISN